MSGALEVANEAIAFRNIKREFLTVADQQNPDGITEKILRMLREHYESRGMLEVSAAEHIVGLLQQTMLNPQELIPTECECDNCGETIVL